MIPLFSSRRLLGAAALVACAFACGGGEQTAPAENPVPVLTAVTPTSLTAGVSTPVTIALDGSGFVAGSIVRWNGAARPTTVIGPSRLTATLAPADLAASGTYLVSVRTPAPGGGTSNERPIVVDPAMNPSPSISGLSQTSAPAGSGAIELAVDGAGFMAQSVILIDGASRPTTFESATRLRAQLPAADLETPGDRAVTVSTPAPGGGLSGAAVLHVVAEVPVLAGLTASGGTAGSGPITLAVDGERFARGAVAQWNGGDRPTTFRSGTRLRMELTAADLAVPGQFRISVRNPGVATASADVVFTVRTVAAPAVTSHVVLDLTVGDIVSDRTRGMLYASVRRSSATLPSTVVAIDPASGVIVGSTAVGDDPRQLALSDDGTRLYVAEAAGGRVRRLAVPSLAAELELPLPANVGVFEMEVVPGRPERLVVALRSTASFPSRVGVALYVDAVAQPRTVGGTGNSTITFDGRATTVLYGLDVQTTDTNLQPLRLTSAGDGIVGGAVVRLPGPGMLRGAAGRLYSTLGTIVDPGDASPVVGTLVPTAFGGAWSVLPDPELGRVYFWAPRHLEAFDLNTGRSLGVVDAPGDANEAPFAARVRLARWGADGLAYRTTNAVHIIRTTLASP
jgi:hypothetical protein